VRPGDRLALGPQPNQGPARRLGPLRRVAVTTAAIGLAAVVLAACAGPDETGSPSQRMHAWVDSTQMGASVATLLADSQRIAQVLSAGTGTGAVHTDCALLTTDAEAANSNLPTPDQQLTNDLSNAYTLEYNAGDNCYSAGTTNGSLLAQSARERAKARTLLLQALARAEAVGGHPVSTTTTTNPDSGGIFG
jgi:hypothetical protein